MNEKPLKVGFDFGDARFSLRAEKAYRYPPPKRAGPLELNDDDVKVGLVVAAEHLRSWLQDKRIRNAHDALLEAARLAVADGECFCHTGPESAGRHILGLGPGPCDYCVAKRAVALAEGGEE